MNEKNVECPEINNGDYQSTRNLHKNIYILLLYDGIFYSNELIL